MSQALENFFPRSRGSIQNEIFRVMQTQLTLSARMAGQNCLDWVNYRPDEISSAFARHFQERLNNPDSAPKQVGSNTKALQLLDENTLERQLAQEKVASKLTEALRPELVPLHHRIQTLHGNHEDDAFAYGHFAPLHVLHALSAAIDGLGFDARSGNFLINRVESALLDTLLQTYSALNDFLAGQGLDYQVAPQKSSHTSSDAKNAGQDVLAHIQAVSGKYGSPAASVPSGNFIQHLSSEQNIHQPSAVPDDAQPVWRGGTALPKRVAHTQGASDTYNNPAASVPSGNFAQHLGTWQKIHQINTAPDNTRPAWQGGTAPSKTVAHTQGASDTYNNPAASVPSGNFAQHLGTWQKIHQINTAPDNTRPAWQGGTLVLRQLQQDAVTRGASAFDLAVLDVVAGLFEVILGDPGISPLYKALIAHVQIPVLKAALTSPEFFSDEAHPARQLIDIMGQFSRRFPDGNESHSLALEKIETACDQVLHEFEQDAGVFERTHAELESWLNEEEQRAEARLAQEVAHLEWVERQEMGTLLALENLRDLTERHPAPESVLRRLETGWVPYMATLYVEEAGEGPTWRAAGRTLLQLFLSLQAPGDEKTREARLKSIPAINAELRNGLLAEGASPEQLKNFFTAITTRQECWIRPAYAQGDEQPVTCFIPSQAHDSSTALHADLPIDDAYTQEARQLQEGDWVDFNPPYDGFSTARVAWVGVRGYMLFSDEEGDNRFALDRDSLAAEIRAGRACIPDLSLTRKAMLRLRQQLPATA